MPGWKITLHEQRPEDRKPGDMWPAPRILEYAVPGGVYEHMLSPRYLAMPEPRRAPLVVCLPGGVDFVIDTRAWKDGVHYGDGWSLSGDPARSLTLSPSVNINGIYHGWIRDGVITEDVEARAFPDDPRTA